MAGKPYQMHAHVGAPGVPGYKQTPYNGGPAAYPGAYPPQASAAYPPQHHGAYPPQTQPGGAYPPQVAGPPPPYYPADPYPQQSAAYPPMQSAAYAPQPSIYLQQQPAAYPPGVQITGQYDSSARFGAGASRNIPPPPPGVMPNAAQIANMQGQPVQMSQKPAGWFEGHSAGGSTFW